jgi:hypothetical protein
MKTFLIALCLTSLLIPARAEERKAPAITLKHKSDFDATDVRNPFWPIGWKKPVASTSSDVALAPALTPESFTLTSLATGSGQRFAILNGKVMQEGQVFGLQSGSQIYQVTVKAIQDGQVILSYEGGGDVVVLLRRH